MLQESGQQWDEAQRLTAEAQEQARIAQTRSAEVVKKTHTAEEARLTAEDARKKQSAVEVRHSGYAQMSRWFSCMCWAFFRSVVLFCNVMLACTAAAVNLGSEKTPVLHGAAWCCNENGSLKLNITCALTLHPLMLQAQKKDVNVSGIEEDLDALTTKYNRARQHVRLPAAQPTAASFSASPLP